MYIQLEHDDYESLAESIYNSLHDNGTVYFVRGDIEIAVKYEKHVAYDGWYNDDGTRDVLACDLSMIDVSHEHIGVEYDENEIMECFEEVVHRV